MAKVITKSHPNLFYPAFYVLYKDGSIFALRDFRNGETTYTYPIADQLPLWICANRVGEVVVLVVRGTRDFDASRDGGKTFEKIRQIDYSGPMPPWQSEAIILPPTTKQAFFQNIHMARTKKWHSGTSGYYGLWYFVCKKEGYNYGAHHSSLSWGTAFVGPTGSGYWTPAVTFSPDDIESFIVAVWNTHHLSDGQIIGAAHPIRSHYFPCPEGLPVIELTGVNFNAEGYPYLCVHPYIPGENRLLFTTGTTQKLYRFKAGEDCELLQDGLLTTYQHSLITTYEGTVLWMESDDTTLIVHRSEDGGETFDSIDLSAELPTGRSGPNYNDFIALNARNQLLIPFEDGTGIYSEDDGKTWTHTGDFMPHELVQDCCGGK